MRVDVTGSNPKASPKGFGRSPTMAFPGAVKTFTLSLSETTGATPPAIAVCAAHLPILQRRTN
jgi:hypothetical protein